MSILSTTQLKQKIGQLITTNGNNEITGAQVNEILNDIADSKIDEGTEAALSQDITVIGVSQGGYSNGDVIPAGTTLDELVMNLLQQQIAATYTQPSASLALTGQATTVEVGETYTPELTVAWSQNDAGVLNQVAFIENDIEIASGAALTFSPSGQMAVPDTIIYKADVSYDEGDQLLDNMGNPSGSPISAGTITTNTQTIHVRYKTWYDKNIAVPHDSDEVRDMPDFEWDNVNTLTVPVVAGDTSITIVVPPNKTLTQVEFIGTLTVDQTTVFINSETIVPVAGADGNNPVDHKVYSYQPSSAFSTSSTYKFTLS